MTQIPVVLEEGVSDMKPSMAKQTVTEITHAQVKDETERNNQVAVMSQTEHHGPAPPVSPTVEPMHECPPVPKIKNNATVCDSTRGCQLINQKLMWCKHSQKTKGHLK